MLKYLIVISGPIFWGCILAREPVQDLEHVRNKFNFTDAEMNSVPSNPFTYLREIFKDTALRASQYKMLIKLFNSCERLLLGTLFSDIEAPKIGTHQSDLIQHKTGNRLRHASGPVRANLPPVT